MFKGVTTHDEIERAFRQIHCVAAVNNIDRGRARERPFAGTYIKTTAFTEM